MYFSPQARLGQIFRALLGTEIMNSGQTLVEVLVAVGVTVVFLVAMVGVVTRAIANSQFAKNKALAARYVEESLELARSWRDQATDWETFKTSYNGEVAASPLPSPFVRTMTFTDQDEKKKVEVVVIWTDGKGTHTSQGVTYLTKWE